MTQPNPSHNAPKPVLSRRTVFAGVGAAGAVATVAAVLPGAAQKAAPADAASPPDKGGYQLTEHVQRYYQTAKV